MDLRNKRRVAVFGAGKCSQEIYQLAQELGRLLAPKAIVFTGGRGGVMEAVSRGVKETGGLAVALLPGDNPREANPYVGLPIATSLGQGRNYLLALNAEGAIAVSGGYGTLSEIALALKLGRPVVGLRTWPELEGVHYAQSAEEAVTILFRLLEGLTPSLTGP